MAGGSERFDLCVIGAGPAGLAAAETGQALGAATVIVEAVQTGGVAVNWGALPAQALAASARRAFDIRTSAELAIGAEAPRINFGRLNTHVKSILEAARPDVSIERLVAKGVTVVDQPAIFIDRSTVAAGERRIKARRFILATGSRPHIPDIPGLEAVPYMTPETVFDMTRRPGHLIIVGAGTTGVTLAQTYVRLGCKVTLVDMLTPLGDQDFEFASVVTDRLAHEGVEIIANTGIVSASGDEDGIEITLRTGAEERTLNGTHLLVATGRRNNVDTLDLGKARVKARPDGSAVNLVSRTSNRRIYCVGDASGTRSVTAAQFMGAWAARHAVGSRLGMFLPPLLPHIVLTDPEIAQVGVSEKAARARHGDKLVVTRYPLAGLDRMRARGQTHGHLKIIAAPSGRLIGAGVCGESAGELAAVLALAIAQRLSVHELARLVAPYPALAQAVSLVAAEYASRHPRHGAMRAWAWLKRLLP